MRKTKFFFICFMGLVFTMTAFAQIDGAETMGSFNVPYTQPVSTTSPQPVTPVSTITPQPVVIQPNQLPTAGGIPSIPQTSGSSTPPTSNGVGSTPSQGSSSGAISIPIGGSGGVNSIPTAPYAGTTPPQPTGGPSGSSGSSSSSSPPPPTTDWYLDSDGDGWHGQSTRASTSPGPKWKVTTKGYDCDDSNATKTLCDPNWYLDNDGDGWHSIFTKASTSPGANYKTTTKGLDCDDTKATVTNECNNTKWYLDNDGDGYHITTATAPMRPGTGWKEGISKGLDCDDTKATVTNECNTLNWYLDNDGDGWHSQIAKAMIAPSAKWTTTTKGIDCDDAKFSATNDCSNKRRPCFGATSETDTSNILNTQSIKNALDNAGLANYSSSIIEVFREIGLISEADISGGAKNILNTQKHLGSAIGLLSIGVSAVDYLQEPTTQNLLRFVFDTLTSNPATGATLGLGVSLVELFKDDGGESIIDKALKVAANKIDELSDCDLGAGIHGLIF